MAKDPAFLFYPADASDDTQFMNRLERGAYFDLVKSQRIFRGFTADQLRKILGGDYEQVWSSLELVLKKDGDLYYIPWVRESLEKRENFSKKQSERRKSITADSPRLTAGQPKIENEIENVNEIEKEGVQGDKNLSDPLREKVGKWAYAGFMEYSHILPEDKKTELVRWLVHLKEKDKPPGASTIRELVTDFASRDLADIRGRVSNAIRNNSNGSLWSEKKQIEKQKFGAVPSSY